MTSESTKLQMLSIYLDQNKWIELAIADTGSERGEQHRDVLELARAAVRSQKASFKVSHLNIIENWNANSYSRRQDVARIMKELSGWNAIMPDFEIIDLELDSYFQSRFYDQEPKVINPFGQGLKFLFPIESSLPGPLGQQLETLLEKLISEGPPGEFPLFGIDNSAFRAPTHQYAKAENEVEERLHQHKLSTKKREDAALARVLTDYTEPINKAGARNRIPKDSLYEKGAPGLREFVENVPTLHVYFHLLALRYKNRDLKKTANDLPDLSALRASVPYCDIVVTEKLWAELLNRADFAKKYDTRVLHKLTDLEGELEKVLEQE